MPSVRIPLHTDLRSVLPEVCVLSGASSAIAWQPLRLRHADRTVRGAATVAGLFGSKVVGSVVRTLGAEPVDLLLPVSDHARRRRRLRSLLAALGFAWVAVGLAVMVESHGVGAGIVLAGTAAALGVLVGIDAPSIDDVRVTRLEKDWVDLQVPSEDAAVEIGAAVVRWRADVVDWPPVEVRSCGKHPAVATPHRCVVCGAGVCEPCRRFVPSTSANYCVPCIAREPAEVVEEALAWMRSLE